MSSRMRIGGTYSPGQLERLLTQRRDSSATLRGTFTIQELLGLDELARTGLFSHEALQDVATALSEKTPLTGSFGPAELQWLVQVFPSRSW